MDFDFLPRERPTFYYIGVTTRQSSIMRVFPRWAEHLGIGGTPIVGIDCRLHDDPAVYRRIVQFIKQDANSWGALVTSHKIDLFHAAQDLFDELDPYAKRLGELSCISKRDGKLWGHAKDPITSGLSLEAFLPKGHWKNTGAEICMLGAGGASLALTMYLVESYGRGNGPSRIVVTNRSAGRLHSMQRIHGELSQDLVLEYVHCPSAEENDSVVNRLSSGSLVINGTGLGKDAPGSPLTAGVRFPLHGFAWDYNFRGELMFLDQARAQARARDLHVEDGWVYFLHGWTRVIAEVFHLDIPSHGPEFEKLSQIAAEAR